MRVLLTTLGVALALAGSSGQFGQGPRVSPISAPPRIDAVTPSQGPIAGGTNIVFSGAGFTGAIIRIDNKVVTPLAQSETSIQLRMPAHDNGYVTISARSDSGVAYGRYLYIPPRLDEIPPGYITTVAGVGPFKGDFGPALSAAMDPANVVFDTAGNLYVGEPKFDAVSRIRTDGVIERFAGVGSSGSTLTCCNDGGPATEAYIAFPRGIAIDPQDNVYIADHRAYIRRVDTRTGIITTIAGKGRRAFSGDGGPAVNADIGMPLYLAADGADLFFLDFDASRIRRIDASGRISTFAGNGVRGFSGDGGPATSASFDISDSDTSAIAIDARNVYFADVNNNRIRKIDRQSGIITTLVQTSATSGAFSVGQVFSLAVDRSGNVYYGGTHLVEVSATGALIKVWGSSTFAFSPDGTPIDQVQFIQIDGLTFDGAGNVVYGEQAIGRVRRLNQATGRVETLGGMAPAAFGEAGPAAAGALFNWPAGDVVVTRTGDLLIADGQIRRVTPAGQMSTIAGRSLPVGLGADGVPAYDAPITTNLMNLDAADEIDTVFFGDSLYHIDRNNIARVVTGRNGPACGYTGDGGPARAATLCQPWGSARDAAGHLFIADTNNNRIRRVDAVTGVMTTFAGTGPVNGKESYLAHGSFCGDGGPALDACLNTPYSVAFDADGNLFVSDWGNSRIRKIDRNGIISTWLEVHNGGYGVFTIRFDRAGNLYTNLGERIVRFDRNGVMTTIAGVTGRKGFSGDGGPALQATILGPAQAAGVAVGSDGDVFFVDNSRVRAVRQGAMLGTTCGTSLDRPGGLQSVVTGSTVRLTWSPASGAASYIIEAGSASGLADLANLETGNPTTVFVASGVGRGTYYVRVKGKSACGTSGATNETIVRVQ